MHVDKTSQPNAAVTDDTAAETSARASGHDAPHALSETELDVVSGGYSPFVEKPDAGEKPRSVRIKP